MARIKSTVLTRKLIDSANAFFVNSADDRREQRRAIQSFVESQLMDANAYAGFRYLNGWPCADDSRIAFYYDARLSEGTRRPRRRA